MKPIVKAEVRAEAVPLPLAIRSLAILSMDAGSLETHIQNILLSNPLLEPTYSSSVNDTSELAMAYAVQPVSLQEELHRQLAFFSLPASVGKAAGLLIDSLDEEGYLRESLSELSEAWKLSVPLLEKALAAVQQLDPPGVGCRNVGECLQLQLKALGDPSPLARELVSSHLEEIARGTLDTGGWDPQELEEALALIRTLSPHPCANLGEDRTQYIVPDIRLSVGEDGKLEAELVHQPPLPVLSPLYHSYLQAGSEEDRTYIRDQMSDARNFIRSLAMRADTMSRIALFLASDFENYFLKGPDAQRPVTLSGMAEELKISVSTASRAVAGKYAEFKGSIFPVRMLFSSAGSGDFSRETILHRIRDILRESPGLSDSQINAQLEKQGIRISRRTVNKYRNMLKK